MKDAFPCLSNQQNRPTADGASRQCLLCCIPATATGFERSEYLLAPLAPDVRSRFVQIVKLLQLLLGAALVPRELSAVVQCCLIDLDELKRPTFD